MERSTKFLSALVNRWRITPTSMAKLPFHLFTSYLEKANEKRILPYFIPRNFSLRNFRDFTLEIAKRFLRASRGKLCPTGFARVIPSFVIATIIFIGAMPGIAHSVEDGIIAVVNDEVITFKDLRDYIRQTYASLAAQGLPDDQVKEMMAELQTNGLKQLIEDKLILSRANAIGIEVRDKLVDQRVEEIKAKYPSEQVFLDALVNNGANVTDLRGKILDQLKIKYVIDHEVKSKVFVNPQEVTEFYEQNKDSFLKSRRVNLDSIYITFIDDKEAARARANEAMALIKEGKDFEEVAKQYSDSSSIGVVEEGQFLPDIEKIVFSLTQGQVSDSVETDKGIFIFKLKGGIPAQVAELKEVKDQVYNLLYRKKFQERFEQWLGNLHKKAYVEIKQ